MKGKVPLGKKVLNTHISIEEHTFLKREAKRQGDTVTHVLRGMIRAEMRREQRALRDLDRPNEYTQIENTLGFLRLGK